MKRRLLRRRSVSLVTRLSSASHGKHTLLDRGSPQTGIIRGCCRGTRGGFAIYGNLLGAVSCLVNGFLERCWNTGIHVAATFANERDTRNDVCTHLADVTRGLPMTPRGVSMPMGYHVAGVHARYECIQVLHLVDECSPLAYTISRPRARQIPPTSVPFALARDLSLPVVTLHASNTASINRQSVRPPPFTVICCLLIDFSVLSGLSFLY